MLFSEVIGQEALKKQLVHLVEQKRLSHALLFAGPEGAGALPLAIAFASKTKNEALVTSTNMRTETELAATYDFGVAKVGLGYGSKTARTGDALVAWGISVPVGAMTFGLNGADRGTAKFIEGGAKYALSKRTTLNVMFGTYDMNAVATKAATATAAGSGAIDAIKGGNQSRFGIVHTF